MRRLYWLEVQPCPGDLSVLNALDGHTFHIELLSIDLRPMIVQFGPYGVSLCHLVEDHCMYIWDHLSRMCVHNLDGQIGKGHMSFPYSRSVIARHPALRARVYLS